MGGILNQISASVRLITPSFRSDPEHLATWSDFHVSILYSDVEYKILGAALSHLLFGYYKKIMKKIQAVSTWKAGEYRIPHPLPPWI